jgi:hypothetical protein
MQAWQIKAIELEVSAFNRLDGFIHEHALYSFIGVIYLLLALLVLVLLGALRRKRGQSTDHVRTAIVVHFTTPPPPPEPPFDPFPPLREPPDYYDHDN